MNQNSISAYLGVDQEQSVISDGQHAARIHAEELVHAVNISPGRRLPVDVLVPVQYHFMVAWKEAQRLCK